MEKINKNKIKGKLDVLLIAVVIVAIIGIVVFSGCIGEPQKEQKPALTEKETKIWVDYFNRSVEVPAHPERIIALSPFDIEILFAMGLGNKIVGRHIYAYYPPEVSKVPACGYPFEPNFEVILNQSPDLIILFSDALMNAEEYKDIIRRFEKYNLSVVINPNHPNTIYGVIDYIKHTGKLVGEEEKAEAVVKEMDKKINFVKGKVKDLKENEKPRVGIITIFGENIFANELAGTQVEIAGGINAFKGIREKRGSTNKSTTDRPFGIYISPEALIEINPDVVIITPAPPEYSKNKTEDEVKQEQPEKIKNIPGWQELKAVKNNRICVIDAFKVHGTPRVADGLIEIGKCIHPELFGNENVPDETN